MTETIQKDDNSVVISRNNPNKLTRKQELFCYEYVKELNATKAAISARYKEKTAHTQGSKLLKNPKVAEKIQSLMHKRSERIEISADKVLLEILKLATTDITEAFNEDGSVKPLKEIPPDVRKCISSLSVSELFQGQGENRRSVGTISKIKFWDKTKSLELLGRHLKLFGADLGDLGNAAFEIVALVNEAKQRALKTLSQEVSVTSSVKEAMVSHSLSLPPTPSPASSPESIPSPLEQSLDFSEGNPSPESSDPSKKESV